MSYRPDARIGEYQSFPVSRDCSPKELRSLVDRGTRLDATTGRVLARQGAYRREFVVVISGGADVVRDGRIVEHLGPGDHHGEFTLLRGVPQPATVVVTEPSVLDVYEARDFQAAYHDLPAFRTAIDHELDRRTAAWLTVHPESTPATPALAEW